MKVRAVCYHCRGLRLLGLSILRIHSEFEIRAQFTTRQRRSGFSPHDGAEAITMAPLSCLTMFNESTCADKTVYFYRKQPSSRTGVVHEVWVIQIPSAQVTHPDVRASSADL